jgi:AcrR family transcriptional regulator
VIAAGQFLYCEAVAVPHNLVAGLCRLSERRRRTHAQGLRGVVRVAERLVQTRGINGFSYADVAGELGVTKASLHYHFPGKAELGVALINRDEAWLERLLEQGTTEGALHYEGRAREQAQLIISTLEGAMLVARPYGNPQRFRAAEHRLLASLDGEQGTS